MSFNIALSGIAAAQTDLDTTANNVANVSTVGFKESRAEFQSVFANSIFTNSATQVGDGASVVAVAQQFHQGSLKFTQNPLDLAITGSGFFATTTDLADQSLSYTRDGTFKLNEDNFIVNNSGSYLQAFPVNEDGTSSSVSVSTTEPIQIPDTAGTPVKTGEISITMNLPSGDGTLDPAAFNPDDSDTYNNSTSVTVYDSLGEAHIVSTYYIKGEEGADILSAGADGTQALTLNFDEPTQYASSFEVTALEQDGLTVGRLTGVEIADDGLVQVSYSNGTSQPLARVAVVRFSNEQGLTQKGSTWEASTSSGDPLAGEANSGSFGSITSAALEQSNVNLTTELVDLITAQRNFQANSRALEINNTLQDTILQIR